MGEGLRVIKLVTENVKGLKAVEISPDPHFQVIGGKNGNGKSSVLDAIWMALGGADATKNVDRPIRDGETEAYTYLDMGDIIVARKWKRTESGGVTTSLEVRTKDGAKYSSPQKVLDGLIGKISFDPGAFANMDPDKQKRTMMDLIGVDVDSFDSRIKIIYDARTDVNRQVKNLEALLKTLPEPAPNLPEKPIDVNAIAQEMAEAMNQKTENDKKRLEVQTLRNIRDRSVKDLEMIDNEIEQLERRLRQLCEDRQKMVNHIEDLNKQGQALLEEVNALVDPDTSEFMARMEEANTINKRIQEASEYRRTLEEYNEAKKRSEQMTANIKAIEAEKQSALENAQFPIPGIGFDETGVTFNGVPLKQCSDAERLKVSMAVAMAINPKIRVIRITQGSLLDEDSMEVVRQLAKDNDYQVWMEVVGGNVGEAGVIIEAGEIKTKEEQAP